MYQGDIQDKLYQADLCFEREMKVLLDQYDVHGACIPGKLSEDFKSFTNQFA